MKNPSQSSKKDEKLSNFFEEGHTLISDIIINYRTLISFGPKTIEYLINKSDKLLRKPNY